MKTVWSDRCSYFLDRECKTFQWKSDFLCMAMTCCTWRCTDETALSLHLCYHIHQWMWKQQSKHNKKQTPNISKGVSLGPSQYWGFGKLRAEDINSVFWHTIPRVSVITACRRQFWTVNSCLHTPVRLERVSSQITLVYTESYRKN